MNVRQDPDFRGRELHEGDPRQERNGLLGGALLRSCTSHFCKLAQYLSYPLSPKHRASSRPKPLFHSVIASSQVSTFLMVGVGLLCIMISYNMNEFSVVSKHTP